MENTYENAYVEVLEILKQVSKQELEKIPKEEIEFFEKNKNLKYEYRFNFDEPMMLRKTSIIMVSLYKNYLATLEEKDKINEILILNERKSELEKKKEYENQALFQKMPNNKEVTEQETALIVKKEKNWVEKLISKIKNFFK